jgi:hypothetical protein
MAMMSEIQRTSPGDSTLTGKLRSAAATYYSGDGTQLMDDATYYAGIRALRGAAEKHG